jgi:hypothetical protein
LSKEAGVTQSLVVAAGTFKWIDVAVLGVFVLGIVAILLVPFTIDTIASHKTYRVLTTSSSAHASSAKELQGVPGLARATMAFGVIAVIGFALGYILVAQPFSDNKTITNDIVIALTTTLASITAFYFGSRLATQVQQDAAAAVAAGAAGVAKPVIPSIAIATPAEGATYALNDPVIASYTCTPSAGAHVTTCDGTVANGSPIDTSQSGTFTFTVKATDSAGKTNQVSHSYTVQ